MKSTVLVPLAIALCFGLTLPTAGIAAPHAKAAPAVLSPADKALVDQAAIYMQGLKSVQARFSQTDPRGAITNGTFSLQRPGKARFAYDAPTDLTVVSDGTAVSVYDGRLKTFDKYPLKSTPIAMLLGDQVKFDKAAVITAVARDKTGFIVTLRDAGKQAEGQLSLNFSTAPVALTGWTVIDAQGQKTQVRLSGLKNMPLAADLFVLKDPHPPRVVFKP